MDIPANLPVTEITSGAILVWILQQLKKLPWGEWLPPWSYRVISIIWAIMSTLIVGRLTVGPSAFPQHGEAAEIGIDVWYIASQFIVQELTYRLTGTQPAKTAEAEPAAEPASLPHLPPHASGTIPPKGYQ